MAANWKPIQKDMEERTRGLGAKIEGQKREEEVLSSSTGAVHETLHSNKQHIGRTPAERIDDCLAL